MIPAVDTRKKRERKRERERERERDARFAKRVVAVVLLLIRLLKLRYHHFERIIVLVDSKKEDTR